MQRLTSATRPQRLADASDSFRQLMHDVVVQRIFAAISD